MEPRIEVVPRLDDDEVARVAVLVEHATEADGARPLSEHATLHLRHGGDSAVRHVLAYDADLLVGYAHVDPTDLVAGSSAEVVVEPAARRHGVGRRLVREALALSPDKRLRLWAHGDHPGASRLAAELGLTRTRALLQLRRSLYAAIPPASLPEGVTVRTFRPGRDETEWVALNARAFAGHPEQGRWTLDDLRARMDEPWFDPDGFFLAQRADPDRLVAFHWTKVHGATEGADEGHGHAAIGEVYVVGVDPGEQGNGLGRAMTVLGLQHLRSRGLAEVMLYVDADNAAAVRLYEGLGFTRWDTDVMFGT